MRFLPAIYMAFFVTLVDCLTGCVSTATLKEGKLVYDQETTPEAKPKKEFHQLVATTIPIADDGELNADIFRPVKKSQPKTLVIMVPGSGNVSRKGEVSGDGVHIYDENLLMYYLWASALAERGLFVMSYDKRTCTKSINPDCRTNDQKDIETEGIVGLARDLDHVLSYAHEKLGARPGEVRVVLMSTTQGAQTIALSDAVKRVNGVVLLSPIVTDLESMWIKGLAHAAKNASPNQKMRLMNQRESMVSFFKSLNAGQFPEQSIIRGASVKFWRTWIDATTHTVETLRRQSHPTLLMFSSEDSFSSSDVLAGVKKQVGNSNKLSIKMVEQVDRNFASKDGVAKNALDHVVNFIQKIPLEN